MNKNIDKSYIQDYDVDPGFRILKIHNKDNEVGDFYKSCDVSVIQMHFSLSKGAKLQYNMGAYGIDIPENKSLLLYNPQKDLPIHLVLEPNAKFLILLVSIEKFHSFFTIEAGLIHFLNDENKNKKYYFDKELSPNELVVLNQLFHYGLHSSLEKLYSKGKVYELLSLYFHKSDNDNEQKCPFLEDEANIEKIRKAKNILIDNLSNPPTLSTLANEINLPIQHLKDGFKQIYGETAFSYLLNYKMEYARKLLATKKYNITETSFEIGYSTPSHFIAAFKKKYGSTPKKYLSNL